MIKHLSKLLSKKSKLCIKIARLQLELDTINVLINKCK